MRPARSVSRLPFAAVAATLIASVSLPAGALQDPGQVETLLARARAALGGEARLAAITTIVVEGDLERCTGASCSYGHFQSSFEAPCAFVRTEHVSGTMPSRRLFASDGITPIGYPHEPTTVGLDGDRLILPPLYRNVQHAFSRPAVEVEPVPTSYVQSRRALAQIEFARFTVGLLAATPPSLSLRIEAIPGDPHAVMVLDLHAPARLAFDPVSHLPASFGEYAFQDYRDVDGVRMPFRVVRTVDRRRHVETTKKVRINVPIAPEIFGR